MIPAHVVAEKNIKNAAYNATLKLLKKTVGVFMFRKPIKEVVRECNVANAYYILLCSQTLFGGHTDLKQNNKSQNFSRLLRKIADNDYSSTEAIISVYQFYQSINGSSRLRTPLMEGLLSLLDIEMPYTDTIYGQVKNQLEAEELLDNAMSEIMRLAGFESERDEMLLPLGPR